jgi:hypothetical protein
MKMDDLEKYLLICIAGQSLDGKVLAERAQGLYDARIEQAEKTKDSHKTVVGLYRQGERIGELVTGSTKRWETQEYKCYPRWCYEDGILVYPCEPDTVRTKVQNTIRSCTIRLGDIEMKGREHYDAVQAAQRRLAGYRPRRLR